jgi:ribonuclease J
MYIKIHRGTRQIGGSIIEIGAGDTKIILDCGTNLPAIDGRRTEDNIEIDGLTCGESKFDGVFITHYHNDHCGLMGRVNADIPVYAGAETKAVLGVIADFIDAPPPRIDKILESGAAVSVGDIEVLPSRVAHSAYGALMLLIRAEGESALYTGDFNGIEPSHFPRIGKIDALLCEGTNIEAEKTGLTEDDVRREAAALMRKTDCPVFVLASSANIDRVKSIEGACHESGRTIAVDLFQYALLKCIGNPLSAKPVGFMSYFLKKEDRPRQYKYFSENAAFLDFHTAEAVAKMPNLTYMVRCTMGDFMKRLNRHAPLKGSVLIYSMWKGYRDRPQTKEFLELCRAHGMEIVDLHTSGHAYREVLRETVTRLAPDVLIPIHTESPEGFAGLHDNVVLPVDGETIPVQGRSPARV